MLKRWWPWLLGALAGLVFAPWAHRLLRRFHVEAQD